MTHCQRQENGVQIKRIQQIRRFSLRKHNDLMNKKHKSNYRTNEQS